MKQIAASFAGLLRDERGATAIEYGLIAGVLSLGIVAALTMIGGTMKERLAEVVAALQ